MDGRKITKGVLFAGFFILALTACRVKPSGYVSLYIDNITSLNNTVGEVPLNMREDTALSELTDTSPINVQELPVVFYPTNDMLIMSFDSTYRHEVKTLLKAIVDSFQVLRIQILEVQNQHVLKIDSNSQGKSIQKEQPLDSFETEVNFQQLIQEKNDTNTMLRNQVTELHVLHDTIRLNKTQELSLEEQIIQGEDIIAFVEQDGIDFPYKSINDTTIILVAFYEIGEVKPLEEDSILKQVEELFRNYNITRITLAGYVDSSDFEIINKEVTNARLNYLSEKISQVIAKEKLFFQNLGILFTSDMAVRDERRIEIRIHTKYDNNLYLLRR